MERLWTQAVEAYHAGLVRRMLYDQANTTVEAYGVTVEQIVEVNCCMYTVDIIYI